MDDTREVHSPQPQGGSPPPWIPSAGEGAADA